MSDPSSTKSSLNASPSASSPDPAVRATMRPNTHQKALMMNLSRDWYGTLAEIGAGQETSQWLFHVGGASGTVAKTISAYDMTFSDAIYGKAGRYVSRQRLGQMLDHEYQLLRERLDPPHDVRRFFCFADTIAATSFTHHGPGHGWLGVRFQLHEDDETLSDIIIHVNLLDLENAHQQEAVGVVGINLLYGAYALHDHPTQLIDSLMDELSRNRIEIDTINFDGPVSRDIDNRLMSMELVSRGLTDAAMFTAQGENVQLADRFHHRPILLQRGTFRPVVRPVVRMVELGEKRLREETDATGGGNGGRGIADPVVVAEMNLKDLNLTSPEDRADLLGRLEVLETLGRDVLITNYRDHYQLAQLLSRYTDEPIAMVMGVPTLRMVLDPKYYDDLAGGLLEAMGRLFRKQVRFYIYPYQEAPDRELVTLDDVRPEGPAAHLFAYLLETGAISALEPDQSQDLSVFPDQVLEMIRNDAPGWREKVPDEVAHAIEQDKLFDYPA